jgi:hypothetical protein
MSWNLNLYDKKYIIAEESVYEAGCIHTAQGLELDYVGVIVGKDLRLVHGDVITDVDKRSKNDVSVRGWKTKVKQGDKEVMARVDRIIRNTYKVLMTRGMKGCYVFFEDDSLRDYFNKFIK